MRTAPLGPGPTSHSFFSQRLRLHYVDYGNEDKPLLVLVHALSNLIYTLFLANFVATWVPDLR